MTPKIPKYPLRFLRWFCKPDLLEEIEGDLNEEFSERFDRLGARKARFFYTWQVLTFFRPYAIKSLDSPLFNPITMYRHYLKVAYRNLLKQKVPGLIKTLGLSIGLTTCLMILMYVNYELDFDQFHENPEDIYRLTFEKIREDGVTQGSSRIPMGMLPDIVAQVPEIQSATAFSKVGVNLRIEDDIYRNITGLNVDSNFFKVFQFPLINGMVPIHSEQLNGVYITKTLAEQLFGKDDPIHQMIKLWSWKDTTALEVIGVLQDVPTQSHVQFDLLYPTKKRDWTYSWDGYSWRDMTYLRKYPNAAQEHLQQNLHAFVNVTGGDTKEERLLLQPLLDIHLTSNFDFELEPNGDIRDIYLFSGIALLILCIALINYILTVNADFSRRLREIGIRKATGALRNNIMGQFFTETFLYVLLAIPLVIFFVYFTLPTFSQLIARPLSFALLLNQWSLWILLGGILIVLILAGTYPAWILGRMNIVDSIKGKLLSLETTQWTRKFLLFLQFAITMALIGSLGIIYRQIDFIGELDLGFERKNKLVVNVGFNNQNTRPLKHKILQNPNIKAASVTSWVPAKSVGGSGSFSLEETGEQIEFWFLWGDEDLLDAYGLELTKGQTYAPAMIEVEKKIQKELDEISPRDPNRTKIELNKNLIVNESLVKALGITAEPGELLHYPSFRGKLMGVVKDFNIRDIYEPIKPMTYEYTDRAPYMVISYQAEEEKEVLEYVKASWHSFEASTPLNYFFLDEHLDQVYDKEDRLLTMIGVFALLAIGLACLGVFGLAAITTEQKTKEIGIRKVLGAKVSQILILLNKDFAKLILIAVLAAVPTSIYFMQEWLQQFAYRIDIQPWEFLIASLVVFGIVMLTVSARSLAVALANPVKALRQE